MGESISRNVNGERPLGGEDVNEAERGLCFAVDALLWPQEDSRFRPSVSSSGFGLSIRGTTREESGGGRKGLLVGRGGGVTTLREGRV